MFRNHSYLHHRYSIRFALCLMTLDFRVHAQGGARGQDLGHIFFFFFFNIIEDFFFFFFFNIIEDFFFFFKY